MTEKDTPLDPDIRQSWHRSTLAGLNPGSGIVVDQLAEMNLQSRLMRAATPILEGLENQLHDSNFGLLLADNEGYILHRTFGTTRLAAASDRLGVVIGAQFTEQTSGTNAISTPIETRRGVFVLGEEHFLECLRDQICFGLPIFQLGTRRLEGVINIMGPGRESPALMKPVLTSAVREIQQRLLNTYSDAQVALLLAFRAACEGHRRMPVVAVEPSETFTNGAAATELGNNDLALLKEFAAQRTTVFGDRVQMDLSMGQRTVLIERVSDQGAVFRVLRDEEGTPAVPRATVRYRTVGDDLAEKLVRARNASGHVLISGEPGSGRTAAACSVTADDSVQVIDASDAVVDGSKKWAASLQSLAEQSLTSFVVESVHLLDARLLRVLLDAMEQTSARVVLTTDTGMDSIAPIATHCRSIIELPALRQRRPELASIVASLLADRGVKNVRFTSPALAALLAHDWPRNYKELQSVLDEVLAARSVGDVTLSDIPERYRTRGRRRNLGLLEQAEFDTIRKVLAQVRGNKVQAAELLGISRSTLYSRMKALGLP
ncbi:sigma-54-dependent Fis family transcriptional regulator [Arthrobacter sp. NPDC056691]|uniref:sigma-54-dependent Fis family transcriptional regulator n=1 Tax=Arthrobacter sp. NPDC056691 TaxID=3345913 RepID=UPI0036704473